MRESVSESPCVRPFANAPTHHSTRTLARVEFDALAGNGRLYNKETLDTSDSLAVKEQGDGTGVAERAAGGWHALTDEGMGMQVKGDGVKGRDDAGGAPKEGVDGKKYVNMIQTLKLIATEEGMHPCLGVAFGCGVGSKGRDAAACGWGVKLARNLDSCSLYDMKGIVATHRAVLSHTAPNLSLLWLQWNQGWGPYSREWCLECCS